MQKIDGRYVYSASDLNNYLECRRLSELDKQVADKLLTRPEQTDASAELIARKGIEHERKHFERLAIAYGDALVAFEDRAENTDAGLRVAEAATIAAMESGAEIIYQATFFDGTFLGRADFLRKVPDPRTRWGWNYEVLDTKLALSTKPYFLIQLCNYSDHIARITGFAPEYGYIVLGSGLEKRYRIDDYSAYYRYVKSSFLANVETLANAYPWSVPHCAVCVWDEACEKRREDDDHLSVVAGIRREQIGKLQTAGIMTMTDLAESEPAAKPRRMADETFENLRMQAKLQCRQRAEQRRGSAYPYSYEFHETEERRGLANLPPPSPGDVFFDIEGDPLFSPGKGLEYLWGIYMPDGDRYEAFWARNLSEEQAAFEGFVDFIVDRQRAYPDMHVYHYAPYETSALRRLMGLFGSREDAIDGFLRKGTFVDLYPIVRQSLWISQPSYSIKAVEKLYRMKRSAMTKKGDDSIVQFESWLITRDDSILDDIRRYNEEDCRSTYRLRDWLIVLRDELNGKLETPIAWRAVIDQKPEKDQAKVPELVPILLAGLSAPMSLQAMRELDDAARARWLLAALLQYHRREVKPEWWAYFDRTERPHNFEEDDSEALGGLRWLAEIPGEKIENAQNLVYTFTFPLQEHKLGNKPFCPRLKKSAGTIVSLSDDDLRLRLKVSRGIDPAALTALIPSPPLPHTSQQEAVETVVRAYLDGTLDATYPATADMLLARAPRLADRHRGARVQPLSLTKESISSTVSALDRSYLFMQGPPGSGKTTMGAWAIVDLLAAGKSVGVMTVSHKGAHNLLHKVEETARERAIAFSGAHKASESTDGSAYTSPRGLINSVSEYDDLLNGVNRLISATAYTWANRKMNVGVDYLFIDEAGQVSLADAILASAKARNVVLLGDPLQLPQVSQGSHPVGANLSILEHLLGDAETVPENMGIFLEWSYRMHPSIATFISNTIYEGRLRSAERPKHNRVESAGLTGSGLRWLPVDHSGNGRHSPEEIDRIVDEVRLLLKGTVAVNGDAPRAMTQGDIMIVAPYNVQRRKIAEALTKAGFHEIRVGTVDKFQGQEAPVVFYSMTTSSAEDMPRGKDFLFDKNRFNVAVSRAQCLSVLVASPRLLDAPCRHPEDMLLVNLLCAFIEEAEWIDPAEQPMLALS
jgi:uncharacterized protein